MTNKIELGFGTLIAEGNTVFGVFLGTIYGCHEYKSLSSGETIREYCVVWNRDWAAHEVISEKRARRAKKFLNSLI